MRHAFYITAVTDFQDFIPVISEVCRRGEPCWVAIMDCLEQKRQFYFYEPNEIIEKLKSFFTKNSLILPDIKFYGQDDHSIFTRDYHNINPDVVYVQNIYHKYPKWIPRADNSKVVTFAWHHDSVTQIGQSYYDISLNVVRRQDELLYFSNQMPEWLSKRLSSSDLNRVCSLNTKYLGNLRLESLLFDFENQDQLLEIPDKSCLIIETQVRKNHDNFDAVVKLSESLLKLLKDNGYKVFWKVREKGYPVKNESPLKYCSSKPDVIIERDLNIPSSMVTLADSCNVCFTIQTSTAYWDLKKINSNSAMLIPSPPGSREPRVMGRYYNKGDKDVPLNIIDTGTDEGWSKIKDMIISDKPRLASTKFLKRPSELILDEVERILS